MYFSDVASRYAYMYRRSKDVVFVAALEDTKLRERRDWVLSPRGIQSPRIASHCY